MEVAVVVCFAFILHRTIGFSSTSASLPWVVNLLDSAIASIEWQIVSIILIGIVSTVLRFISNRAITYLRCDIEKNIREQLIRSIFEIPWEDFHKLGTGRLQKELLLSIERSCEGIEHLLLGAGTLLVIIVLALTAVVIAPSLGGPAFAFLTIMVLILSHLGKWVRQKSTAEAAQIGRVAVQVSQAMDNQKFLRASGFVGEILQRLQQNLSFIRLSTIKRGAFKDLQTMLIDAFGVSLLAMMILFNVRKVGLEFGQFTAFMGLLSRIVPRISQFHNRFNHTFSRIGWVGNWFTLTDEMAQQKKRAESWRGDTPIFERELCFNRVSYSFEYGSLNRKPCFVLEGASLTVPKGALVGITGISGSGKTTVLDLALGLIVPSQGTVTLDGRSLLEIDIVVWRRCVGYVSQDPYLFSGTVLENIAFGDSNPDRDFAKRCLEDAGAWSFVSSLPGRIDSGIGERGGQLSGGQRQRLNIARALYRRPKVIFFDEPTCSLDEESTAVIRDVMILLKKQTTVVLVTHDEKMLAIADQVWIIKQGKFLRVPSVFYSGLTTLRNPSFHEVRNS